MTICGVLLKVQRNLEKEVPFSEDLVHNGWE
jgi:hypothetical protein